MKLNLSKIPSPLGTLLLVTDDQQQVRALDFSDHEARLHRVLREHYVAHDLSEAPAPSSIGAALDRYFAGDLTALDHITIATEGSDLQRRVWSALRKIPVGRTASYGELAHNLGLQDPRAAIDVGAANNSNPVAIVVPCHRVVAKNGELKGYAGGVHRKRWLLKHEGALAKLREPVESMRLPGV